MCLTPEEGIGGIIRMGPGGPVGPFPPEEEHLRHLGHPEARLPEPETEIVVLRPSARLVTPEPTDGFRTEQHGRMRERTFDE